MAEKLRKNACLGRLAISGIVALMASLAAPPCSAARVYQLVDYPADQAGNFLSGTITTTDTAPLDSILDTAEILDWQWSITGPIPVVASRSDFQIDDTVATRVRITNSTIELPLATIVEQETAIITLARRGPVPRGAVGHRINWFTYYDSMTGPTTSYSASTMHSDVLRAYWFGPSSGTGPTTWIVAIAVPEPTGSGLAVGIMISAILSARDRRPFSDGWN